MRLRNKSTCEEAVLEAMVAENGLDAAVVLCWSATGDYTEAKLLWSAGVPAEPFRGAESRHLLRVVKKCEEGGKSCRHKIDGLAFSNIAKRLGKLDGPLIFANYSKCEQSGRVFAMLGFECPRQGRKQDIHDALQTTLRIIADSSSIRINHQIFLQRLEKTEYYVREVGHDIATCIQALFGDLEFMADGELETPTLQRMAEDSLNEMKNVAAIAESLGITIDPDFQLRQRVEVRIDSVISEVVKSLSSEARERGVTLRIGSMNGVQAFGDEASLRLCIHHLMHNAIKYSHHDGEVEIHASRDDDHVVIAVRNRGIGLPKGSAIRDIWDFGFRSPKARKLNVNGSGVGLYTAKKIVLAHSGRIWPEESHGNTIFYVSVPMRKDGLGV